MWKNVQLYYSWLYMFFLLKKRIYIIPSFLAIHVFPFLWSLTDHACIFSILYLYRVRREEIPSIWQKKPCQKPKSKMQRFQTNCDRVIRIIIATRGPKVYTLDVSLQFQCTILISMMEYRWWMSSWRRLTCELRCVNMYVFPFITAQHHCHTTKSNNHRSSSRRSTGGRGELTVHSGLHQSVGMTRWVELAATLQVIIT